MSHNLAWNLCYPMIHYETFCRQGPEFDTNKRIIFEVYGTRFSNALIMSLSFLTNIFCDENKKPSCRDLLFQNIIDTRAWRMLSRQVFPVAKTVWLSSCPELGQQILLNGCRNFEGQGRFKYEFT